MEIRALQEADARDWWNLRLESLREQPFAFGKTVEEHSATTPDEAAQRFRTVEPGSCYLGAFEQDRLIGMVTLLRHSSAKERHKAHIYGVYVQAAHRGLGIGKRLLQAAIGQAAGVPSIEQILLAVGSTQDTAKHMYRSLGFETFGLEPRALKIGTTYIDEEHMILRLREG